MSWAWGWWCDLDGGRFLKYSVAVVGLGLGVSRGSASPKAREFEDCGYMEVPCGFWSKTRKGYVFWRHPPPRWIPEVASFCREVRLRAICGHSMGHHQDSLYSSTIIKDLLRAVAVDTLTAPKGLPQLVALGMCHARNKIMYATVRSHCSHR